MRGRPRILQVVLDDRAQQFLQEESQKGDERRALRAKILLLSAQGLSNLEISQDLKVSTSKINRILKKYRFAGLEAALCDLSRSGRPQLIKEKDRTFIKLLACQKPFNLPNGPKRSLWTLDGFTSYVNKNAKLLGHESLSSISRAAIEKILNRTELAVRLENKVELDFDKQAEVSIIYKRLEFLCAPNKIGTETTYTLSNGDYGRISQAEDYKIISLMLGVNLLSGKISVKLAKEQTPTSFIEFLKILSFDNDHLKINLITDKHPIHTSKEVKDFLENHHREFSLIFKPKSLLVLDAVEKFISKFVRVSLEGLSAYSLLSLENEIKNYLDKVNVCPVASRWKVDPLELADFVDDKD